MATSLVYINLTFDQDGYLDRVFLCHLVRLTCSAVDLYLHWLLLLSGTELAWAITSCYFTQKYLINRQTDGAVFALLCRTTSAGAESLTTFSMDVYRINQDPQERQLFSSGLMDILC